MIHDDLHHEALQILTGKSAILDVAREVTDLLGDADLKSAVIGGVACVLHGHVRTTVDVDVYVAGPVQPAADLLQAHDFTFSSQRREFAKHDVPVHLVRSDELGRAPTQFVTIDGIITVALPDLINIKLASGSRNILRAQDLADVIGLIRHHRLTNEYAPRIDKPLRPEFRKLVTAIASDR